MSKDNLNKIKALAAEGLLTKDNIRKAIKEDYYELLRNGSTGRDAALSLSVKYDMSDRNILRIVSNF